MRKIALLLGLALAGATGCSTRPYGSSPELESTKLHDVVSSELARVVLDPSEGPVAKVPRFTDNSSSAIQSLTQLTTDSPGREQGLINAIKRAKTAGARFYTADCTLARQISIGGVATIRSSYPGIATWPAGVQIYEAPVTTYVAPKIITGKSLKIQVDISVGGGSILGSGNQDPRLLGDPPPPATTCSKAIASLLE